MEKQVWKQNSLNLLINSQNSIFLEETQKLKQKTQGFGQSTMPKIGNKKPALLLKFILYQTLEIKPFESVATLLYGTRK